ncbi:unnamed protein product [Cuscuta campestris]|uniref:Ubiquitin-like protease family profile domain-containing protein n=1 Tax=Cuscuta campestris TaxID=132261 RepID=A0A484NPG9_9ASTE|nr:unnamed protein product [Cuscuta campestris]
MEDELGATQDVPPDQVVIDEERNMYESLVAANYLRISDPADYIVAHGSVFPRAPGDMVHGVPLLPHQRVVAWRKSLVGFGDPPLHTARHGDFSSSKSRPILGVCPTAPPSSPVQDVVDRSSYVSFGLRCRELCQWLTRTSDLPTISVILDPESMLYPEETGLRMRLENIRDFMRWEEVDQTIIIVFLRSWIDVPGVPQQVGNVECGYYTMRFCWLIVSMCAQCSLPLSYVFQSTSPYTRAELEEIREFWAGGFLDELA